MQRNEMLRYLDNMEMHLRRADVDPDIITRELEGIVSAATGLTTTIGYRSAPAGAPTVPSTHDPERWLIR